MTLGGGGLDIFFLTIRICVPCFCGGRCAYSGHVRPSLMHDKSAVLTYVEACKMSFFSLTKRLRPLLLCRSRYLLKTGTSNVQIVCWGTKRPINLPNLLKNNSRVHKTTLLSLTKTTAPCGDKPDCSYKNGLSVDVL